MISNLSFEGEVIEITESKTILESRKNKFWFWTFKFNVPVEHSAYLEISICSSRERCNLEINICEFSNYQHQLKTRNFFYLLLAKGTIQNYCMGLRNEIIRTTFLTNTLPGGPSGWISTGYKEQSKFILWLCKQFNFAATHV